MNPVMNDTKWEELRLAMYELGDLSPAWSTRDLSGSTCPFDREWFYHFRDGDYGSIEWVDLRLDRPGQAEPVEAALRRIHVPGHRTDEGYRIYGYARTGASLDYI